MAGTFRNLEVWKEGLELVSKIYELTRKYPTEEKYGLVDQTRRSANSVIANIAEAHGRYHFADKCRVLYQSRGECEETQSHLSVALKLKFISEDEFNELDRRYEILAMRINAYIQSIKSD